MVFGTRWVGWGRLRPDHKRFGVYVKKIGFYFECHERAMKIFKPEMDTIWCLNWKNHSLLGRGWSEKVDRYVSEDACHYGSSGKQWADMDQSWLHGGRLWTLMYKCWKNQQIAFVEQREVRCEEILLDFLTWFRNDYIWVIFDATELDEISATSFMRLTLTYASNLSSSVTSYKERTSDWALRNSTCFKVLESASCWQRKLRRKGQRDRRALRRGWCCGIWEWWTGGRKLPNDKHSTS